MCLQVNFLYHNVLCPKPIEAQTDIVCYKVLLKGSKGICTPFMKVPIKLKRISIFKRRKVFKSNTFDDKPDGLDQINCGIHVAIIYDRALRICNALTMCHNYDSIIIPVIIPKGTRYWVGTNDDMCAEYISFPMDWEKLL